MITLLVDPAGFDHPTTKVEGEAYQHLFRARRVAVGEEMRVVDGRGRARWGKVERVDRTSATVALGEPAPDREPELRLELIVPTCRPERASWLVEKGTEVGVSAVRFANMARAPRELGTITFDRLRRVAAAAVEQCHRSRLPEITGPHAWSEMVGLAGPEVRWFLDTEAAAPGGWGAAAGKLRRPPGRSRGRARSGGAARAPHRRLASRGARRADPPPGDRRGRRRGVSPARRFRNPESKIANPKLTRSRRSG